jgi:hypothetical protein
MKETRFSTPVNNDTFVEMEFWCDPAILEPEYNRLFFGLNKPSEAAEKSVKLGKR